MGFSILKAGKLGMSSIFFPARRSGPCSHSRGLQLKLSASGATVQRRHNSGSHTAAAWEGLGTQEELMVKDQCITVSEADKILGHASKYDVHRFSQEQPRGVLHRAFSVFLFDSQNRLLLQQRAAGKFTFPNVWTNTCCSHPLYGQDPPEVDSAKAIAAGTVEGAKTAAVRKLRHELGISAGQLPAQSFKYLTRLHYCASDTATYGPAAQWGEHEMDYILFARADVDLKPNPEEVQATSYVSHQELTQMMAPENGLLWSPWFRIICEQFLERWWTDLDRTLHTDEMMDVQTIHRILE